MVTFTVTIKVWSQYGHGHAVHEVSRSRAKNETFSVDFLRKINYTFFSIFKKMNLLMV